MRPLQSLLLAVGLALTPEAIGAAPPAPHLPHGHASVLNHIASAARKSTVIALGDTHDSKPVLSYLATPQFAHTLKDSGIEYIAINERNKFQFLSDDLFDAAQRGNAQAGESKFVTAFTRRIADQSPLNGDDSHPLIPETARLVRYCAEEGIRVLFIADNMSTMESPAQAKYELDRYNAFSASPIGKSEDRRQIAQFVETYDSTPEHRRQLEGAKRETRTHAASEETDSRLFERAVRMARFYQGLDHADAPEETPHIAFEFGAMHGPGFAKANAKFEDIGYGAFSMINLYFTEQEMRHPDSLPDNNERGSVVFQMPGAALDTGHWSKGRLSPAALLP